MAKRMLKTGAMGQWEIDSLRVNEGTIYVVKGFLVKSEADAR